jgi:hypothetical protein
MCFYMFLLAGKLFAHDFIKLIRAGVWPARGHAERRTDTRKQSS